MCWILSMQLNLIWERRGFRLVQRQAALPTDRCKLVLKCTSKLRRWTNMMSKKKSVQSWGCASKPIFFCFCTFEHVASRCNLTTMHLIFWPDVNSLPPISKESAAKTQITSKRKKKKKGGNTSNEGQWRTDTVNKYRPLVHKSICYWHPTSRNGYPTDPSPWNKHQDRAVTSIKEEKVQARKAQRGSSCWAFSEDPLHPSFHNKSFHSCSRFHFWLNCCCIPLLWQVGLISPLTKA